MGKAESRIPENRQHLDPITSAGFLAFRQTLRRSLTLLLLTVVGPVLAQATGKLNDTGMTRCGNNTSNSVTCSYADTDTTGTWPRQDGQMGRTAKDNTTGQTLTKATGASSSKGFEFQKLAYIGGAGVVATTAQGITAGLWGCTKDIVTGLIWDTKVTTASNARLNTNTYNWTLSNGSFNGTVAGSAGTASGTTCWSSNCDTDAFITFINAIDADGAGAGTAGVCGETLNDWRLPTRAELMNLVDAAKAGTGVPAIDATYFPNMRAGKYWTRDNVAADANSARWVDISTGQDGTSSKSSKYFVILVRP
jgi:hypothetical protein